MLLRLYVCFSQPGTNKELINLLSEMKIKPLSITRLCETRWACRFKNCDAVLNNFGALIKILMKEVDEGVNRDVPQAIGNNKLFEHFYL